MKTKIAASLLSFLLLFTVFASAAGKSYDWYFKPNKTHEKPEIIPEAKSFIDNYNVAYYGKTDEKILYLTFDSGYDNGYHGAILDTLKEKSVKAAFFVDGNFIKNNAETAKRIIEEGHLLCNHSKSHPDTTKLSKEEFEAQLKGWEEICKEYTGYDGAKFYRPPMGKFTEATLGYTDALGYKTVFWSFAYADWKNYDQPDKTYAINNIMERVHPGAIMLLHSTSKTNSEILGVVIDKLKAEGYSLDTLDKL